MWAGWRLLREGWGSGDGRWNRTIVVIFHMQELKERYINRNPLAHSWNKRFTAGRMLQTESIVILYECRPPSRQKDTSIWETSAIYGIAKVELRNPEPGIELDPCYHSAALSRIRVQ